MVVKDAASRVELLPADQKAAYERVQFEAYNYYEPQPRSSMDAFIFRHCFHNNTDLECVKMLRAVVPGLEHSSARARLLIIEKLLPGWRKSLPLYDSKRLRRQDVIMMISCGGKERTLEDFRALVGEADGRLTVCLPSVIRLSRIELLMLDQIDQVYLGEDEVAIIAVKLVTLSNSNGI